MEPVTRVLAIADTDSYLKWSAATLAALPAEWTCTQLVLVNPVMPSAAQIRAATSRAVPVVSRRALQTRVRRLRPDVVLLAATGPVVADLAGLFGAVDRPVLVTGLPGISVPATAPAVRYRAGCDLFVLHSHREISEFAALAAVLAPRLQFGLAPLPFLTAPVAPQGGPDLVFAAQAKVPTERAEREQIVLALADAGSVVIKVRAFAEEQQTHREAWPYPNLVADLVRQGRIAANAVRCVAGPMAAALASARGLVTVSSTAALEAMARELPVLVLRDFGISEEMINLVFADSGCLGTLDDVRDGRLGRPEPAWLAANYFHPANDNDWLDRLATLLRSRDGGTLPAPLRTSSTRTSLRRRLRLLVPPVAARRLIGARGRLQRWCRVLGARRPGHTAPAPRRDHPAG
jgi:hypothetical protein